MTELVVGYDYAFGKGRSGDTAFLKEQGRKKGFPVTVVDAHYQDNNLVSSTRIRELVHEGRMMDARELLGRPYQIRGVVQVGKRRGGKEIGYPTANLKVNENDLVPRMACMFPRLFVKGRVMVASLISVVIRPSANNIGSRNTYL